MSVAMFPKPIKGRVFRMNWEHMGTNPITDTAVVALGVHKHVGWFREYTRVLVLENSSRKLYWVEKDDFKADEWGGV